MFTDIAGYTALMQRDERVAVAARDRHRTAIEAAVGRGGGRVLQYFGDGSFSVIPSAVEAIRAAVAIQAELRRAPPLPLRIGVHAGEVALDAHGAYGDAVNIAARLERLCAPGGILVSDRIHVELRNHPDLPLLRVGSAELRHVLHRVELYAVVGPGLAVQPPPERTMADQGTVAAVPSRSGPAGGAGARQAGDRIESKTAGPVAAASRGTLLVGRERELSVLEAVRARAGEGRGGLALIRGDRGIGKSALIQTVVEAARSDGWMVAMAAACPADRLVPLAPLAHALGTAARPSTAATGFQPAAVSDVALPPPGEAADAGLSLPPHPAGATDEYRARLYWRYLSLVDLWTERQPLLLVLDDLQWADPLSLELLQLLARRTGFRPLALLCACCDAEPERRRLLDETEESLSRACPLTLVELGPLREPDVACLVRRVLGDEAGSAVAGRLFRWTRGNPLYAETILRSWAEEECRARSAGRWTGWADAALELPSTLREAMLLRVAALAPAYRALAELLALLGARCPERLLARVADVDGETLTAALDALHRNRVVVLRESLDGLVIEFEHPLMRKALRSAVSPARRRLLHGRIGAALESWYGPDADAHAAELAHHYCRAAPERAATKGLRYRTLAGWQALASRADAAAAGQFRAALRLSTRSGGLARRDLVGAPGRFDILRGLARATHRLGSRDAALALWRDAAALARAGGDASGEARVRREIGVALLGSGRALEAMAHFEAGLTLVAEVADPAAEARLWLAAAVARHHAGCGDAAAAAVQRAAELGRGAGDATLLANAESLRLRLDFWTGDHARVRARGGAALRAARAAGDPAALFWSHWILALAEALHGNLAGMAEHDAEADRVARELGSPVLQLWASELAVVHAYCTGAWEHGLEIGDRAAGMARTLGQTPLLARLLVWTALIRIAREELGTARVMVDEAVRLTGAHTDGSRDRPADVPAAIPAHIGLAAWHSATGDWQSAIDAARRGLALADGAGYATWGLHLLLPILAEAQLFAGDLTAARDTGRRIGRLCEPSGLRLGLAWADACDAILVWLEGDPARGAEMLRRAAEALEALPMIWDAARVRRQLAGRLAEVGHRDAALEELHRVHTVLARLGARGELRKTRAMFAEIGAEPPDPAADAAGHAA